MIRFASRAALVALTALLASPLAVSAQAPWRQVYKDSDVTPDTYCVHADRASDSTANRDFNITERGIVHYIESPSKGTVERGAGTPISTAEAAGGGGAEKKQ